MSDDFEQRMRDMMRNRSAQAPDDYPVVQAVLHDVQTRPTGRQRSRWSTWTVPLVAAGAVAAVAATVVGVQNFHPAAHSKVGVGSTGTITDSPAPTAPASTTTSLPTSAAVKPPAAGPATGLRLVDLSFVGSTAWALAASSCVGSAQCTYQVMRSDNGGAWYKIYGPTSQWTQPGCSQDACLPHLRFANTSTGYVFWSEGLFMSTDGGASWAQQPGSASALETLDGNVIKLDAACSPGCPYTVSTSAIGSSQWVGRTLPGAQPGMVSGVSLVRVAGQAYLDVYGHVAGGAQHATSTLFVSTDGGRTWANRGEPCPQPATGELDSTAIAAGGGSLAVLCTPRGSTTSTVELSTDGGASFRPGAQGVANASAGPLAVSGQTVLLVSTGGLYRSADGGTSWHPVDVPGLGGSRWLGFESPTQARILSADGSTVWTTSDAGADWTS